MELTTLGMRCIQNGNHTIISSNIVQGFGKLYRSNEYEYKRENV